MAAVAVTCLMAYQFAIKPTAIAGRLENDIHERIGGGMAIIGEATRESRTPSPLPQIHSDEAALNFSDPPPPPSYSDKLTAETALKQYRDHREELGYFAPTQYENYGSYSDETLVEMGLNGDILAMQLAAKRAMESGDLEKGLRAHYFASTLGSAYSSLELATAFEAEFAGKDVDEEKFRPFITESIAWKLVAVAQGDAEALIDIQASIDANGVTLTEADRTAIMRRVGELQAAMSSERDKRGFTSDSIEVPPVLTSISHLIKSQYGGGFDGRVSGSEGKEPSAH